MARVDHLDALERLPLEDGLQFLAVREALGVSAVAVAAFRAEAVGDLVVEPHDEVSSPNAGRHEELYVVVAGRARFEIDGTAHDAPAGTLLRIDAGEQRVAHAEERGTTVLVVGGPPGAAGPPSPFVWWYRAQGAVAAGDFERAITLAEPGLAAHPRNGGLHYQLACYHARAGHHEAALDHLGHAVQHDARTRAWAQKDTDLDAVRDAARFPAAP